MKFFFLILFISSCVSPNSNYKSTNENFNFKDDLTFQEFSELLFEYTKKKSHPNIDQ